MKQLLRTHLVVLSVLLAMMVSTVSVGAVTLDEKVGEGSYTILVHNSGTTGIDITGDWFHAYQIFTTEGVTSYSVTDNFKGFFTGNSMVAGDGSGDTFDFQTQLDIMNNVTGTQTINAMATATNEYNQMAGLYFDSYKNNMYTLAIQIRNYLDTYGHYAGATNGITCTAHSQAVYNQADGSQSAYLEGLDTGYYFVMDQESTILGLGIAASGGFLPIVSGQEETTIIIEVKDSVPTVTKEIFHDDLNDWDVVGDHAIGDTVEFLITSTLPANSTDYQTYTYLLSDTMSAGITYNADVAVYTDAQCTTAVDSTYLTINNSPSGDATFTISVDVKALMEADATISTLYTYYTGVVNTNAVAAPGHDSNTIALEYSNNPNDVTQTGTSSATVFHYTFALDVSKVDEDLNGLAGARFGLFDATGTAIPLVEQSVDTATGVVYYTYSPDASIPADGGTITTRTVTLDDGSVVTGKFQINGLNDAQTYILREVEAPEGFNAIEDIVFTLTPTYTSTGTGLTALDDDSDYIHTDGHMATTTIMNRMTVYLPSTGGLGTALFHLGGAALIVGAGAVLFVWHKKEE